MKDAKLITTEMFWHEHTRPFNIYFQGLVTRCCLSDGSADVRWHRLMSRQAPFMGYCIILLTSKKDDSGCLFAMDYGRMTNKFYVTENNVGLFIIIYSCDTTRPTKKSVW